MCQLNLTLVAGSINIDPATGVRQLNLLPASDISFSNFLLRHAIHAPRARSTTTLRKLDSLLVNSMNDVPSSNVPVATAGALGDDVLAENLDSLLQLCSSDDSAKKSTWSTIAVFSSEYGLEEDLWEHRLDVERARLPAMTNEQFEQYIATKFNAELKAWQVSVQQPGQSSAWKS